jgi:hypothetical protein
MGKQISKILEKDDFTRENIISLLQAQEEGLIM